MKLGDTSQLKVYEAAMEHCSEEGNRGGVEMFGRLIFALANEKREESFSKLDVIMMKEVRTKMDQKNARTYKNNIDVYDGWLKNYSPEAPRYIERLSQAEVNSWKQGRGETNCL